MRSATSTVIRMFLLGACVGALAAYSLHEPTAAPLPAAASAAPMDAAPPPASPPAPAPRAREFAALEDRIVVADQALQRIGLQLQTQDRAYREQKAAGTALDDKFWQAQKDSLLAERAARDVERAALEVEYQRYRCENNRYRAECWH